MGRLIVLPAHDARMGVMGDKQPPPKQHGSPPFASRRVAMAPFEDSARGPCGRTSAHMKKDRPPPELLLISRRTQQGSWRRRRAAWAEGGNRALGRVFSRSSGCLRACGQQQEHHRWSLAIGIEVGDRARVSPAELGSRASEEHLFSHRRSTQIARSWRESARHLPCRCRSTMSMAA